MNVGATPARNSPAPRLDGEHAGGGGSREAAGAAAVGDGAAVCGSAAVHTGGEVCFTVPIRTGTGLNDRGHWRVKARKVKLERAATAWFTNTRKAPPVPCTVLLTRTGPSNGLDDDNLRGSLKGVRDEIARWLGVDDRSPLVAWTYAQRRTKCWGVEVTVA